jgi:hypothetical protein
LVHNIRAFNRGSADFAPIRIRQKAPLTEEEALLLDYIDELEAADG